MRADQHPLRIQDGVAAVIFLYAIQVFVHVTIFTAWNALGDPPHFMDDRLLAISVCIAMPLAIFVLFLMGRKFVPEQMFGFGHSAIGFVKPEGRWILATLFMVLVTITAALIITAVKGDSPAGRANELVGALSGIEQTLMLVTMMTASPIAEEIAYRGFLFAAVTARFGVVAGALTSFLVFSLAHLPGMDVYAFSQIAILSAGTVILRLQSGSLLPPILLHMFYNTGAVIGPFL